MTEFWPHGVVLSDKKVYNALRNKNRSRRRKHGIKQEAGYRDEGYSAGGK